MIGLTHTMKRKPPMTALALADRPHAVRLMASDARKRIVTEERNAGPGRVVRVNVVAEVDELDRIKDRLSAPQLRAAEEMRRLWETTALNGRRVTAAYGDVSGMGQGEMSDARAERLQRLQNALRAMGIWYMPSTLALVCFDEPRDLELVQEGLQRAARWWGYA